LFTLTGATNPTGLYLAAFTVTYPKIVSQFDYGIAIMTQDKFTWTTTKAATLTQGDTTQNATSFYDLTFVSKYIYPGSSTIEIIFPTGYSFIADSSCQTTSSIGGIYA
jgi:hypothetical protein